MASEVRLVGEQSTLVSSSSTNTKTARVLKWPKPISTQEKLGNGK